MKFKCARSLTDESEVMSGASKDQWIVRGSVAGLLAVLCFLAGFSVSTQRRVAGESKRADAAARLSATLVDARHWVTEAKSVERRYRFEPSGVVRTSHETAKRRLTENLRKVLEIDPGPEIERLLLLNWRYGQESHRLLAAVDFGDQGLATRLDHQVIDPIFGQLEYGTQVEARAASAAALAHSARLREAQTNAAQAIAIAFAAGLALLACFAFILVRFRRQELTRLAQMAVTDPLTGLRNHRAFQEDLARELQRVGRTGVPLALVMLDLDGLKALNDRLGHQAGDERIQALADAILASVRATDVGYRIGGDEFAVILPGSRALGALELAERVRAQAAVTAGIAEATQLRVRDDVLREAGLALAGAKRLGQAAAVYGPDLELPEREHEHDDRTLASALALAVDAKDSYTRSHCQTVSQLCATIASGLGLDGERVGRIRLAGLLHDVGKIGVPDAILNKPTALTDAEFEVMKRHALLGGDIVAAAEMHEEARWVRHHHERFDGTGYPAALEGVDIPLESRIILVADAFEAMTSDRPYREAPGVDFAVAELQRHAGTQFDPDVVAALCRALDRDPAVAMPRGTS
jgi:diguanylate cyclase (GGDEF)-like protein